MLQMQGRRDSSASLTMLSVNMVSTDADESGGVDGRTMTKELVDSLLRSSPFILMVRDI